MLSNQHATPTSQTSHPLGRFTIMRSSYFRIVLSLVSHKQWRRQDFVTGGSGVWVYRGSRVRSPPVPVVWFVYQRGSLLDGLAMYLSCDMKKFHDNESTHILYNFWTSTHRAGSFLPLAAPLHSTIVHVKAVSAFAALLAIWSLQVPSLAIL